MKKLFKRLLVAGGMAALGYQSFRTYRLYQIARKAETELPPYLEAQYGEKPQISVSIAMNVMINVKIKLIFSPDFLKDKPEIEDNIREYILENYPGFAKCRFKLLVVDSSMSKLDILKKYYPQIYAKFGAQIEKKLREKQVGEVHEEPTD